jgi:hypothetical protein
MRQLVVVTAFAAIAFTAQSAAACDWNREASTEQQTVATTAAPAPQTEQAAPAASQRSTAAAETSSKPVEQSVPVVLVSDHR